MSKRLSSIVKNYLDMTFEEKKVIVEKIRYNKYVLKPAVKVRAAKKTRAAGKVATTAAKKLIDKVSPEELAQVLKNLGIQQELDI